MRDTASVQRGQACVRNVYSVGSQVAGRLGSLRSRRSRLFAAFAQSSFLCLSARQSPDPAAEWQRKKRAINADRQERSRASVRRPEPTRCDLAPALRLPRLALPISAHPHPRARSFPTQRDKGPDPARPPSFRSVDEQPSQLTTTQPNCSVPAIIYSRRRTSLFTSLALETSSCPPACILHTVYSTLAILIRPR